MARGGRGGGNLYNNRGALGFFWRKAFYFTQKLSKSHTSFLVKRQELERFSFDACGPSYEKTSLMQKFESKGTVYRDGIRMARVICWKGKAIG